MLVERGRGRRAGGLVWGHFQKGFGKTSSTCASKSPQSQKNLPSGDSYRFPQPPLTAGTPQTGAGWPALSGITSWEMGYLGISPFPCSQLVPDPPKFYLKQRVSPPKSREKQQAKLPPACPSLISRHVFRFAFSKALSAPGAAEGARAGGSTAPIPPNSNFPGQYSTNTPFSSSPPHSQPTWKNIKIPKLLQ